MAKSKVTASPVSEAVKNLKRGELLPVYYFFGEDTFSIDTAVKAVDTAVKPYITSDFDSGVYSACSCSLWFYTEYRRTV